MDFRSRQTLRLQIYPRYQRVKNTRKNRPGDGVTQALSKKGQDFGSGLLLGFLLWLRWCFDSRVRRPWDRLTQGGRLEALTPSVSGFWMSIAEIKRGAVFLFMGNKNTTSHTQWTLDVHLTSKSIRSQEEKLNIQVLHNFMVNSASVLWYWSHCTVKHVLLWLKASHL